MTTTNAFNNIETINYSNETRKNKVFARISAFLITIAVSLILMLDLRAIDFAGFTFFATFVAGIVSLSAGRTSEIGISSFLAEVAAFIKKCGKAIARPFSSIAFLAFMGVCGFFLLAIALFFTVKAIAWVVVTFPWLVFVVYCIPVVLSVVFSVIDLCFVNKNKETVNTAPVVSYNMKGEELWING